MLTVHLAHLDERAMQDGGLSPHATREYLAWSNTLAKMIGRLGVRATQQKQPGLTDYLRIKGRRRARQRAARGAPDASPQHSTTPASPPAVRGSGGEA